MMLIVCRLFSIDCSQKYLIRVGKSFEFIVHDFLFIFALAFFPLFFHRLLRHAFYISSHSPFLFYTVLLVPLSHNGCKVIGLNKACQSVKIT